MQPFFEKCPAMVKTELEVWSIPAPSKVKKKVKILLTRIFGVRSRGPEHFFRKFRTFRDLSGPTFFGRKPGKSTFFKKSIFPHFLLVPSQKFQNFGKNRTFSCFPEKSYFFRKIVFSSQFSTPQTQNPDPDQTPES